MSNFVILKNSLVSSPNQVIGLKSLSSNTFSVKRKGFLFYTRFFSKSILSPSDKGLNSIFHYAHILLIKIKCWHWQYPNTTNDLKIIFKN